MNYSHRSPKGNRHMRRLLNQTANAAVKAKGTIFDIVYRRSVPRLGHNQAIGAIAHRQCRLIWLILHERVRYEEQGPAVTKQSKQKRTARMIRQLRSLGYRIEHRTLSPAEHKGSDFRLSSGQSSTVFAVLLNQKVCFSADCEAFLGFLGRRFSRSAQDCSLLGPASFRRVRRIGPLVMG